MVTLDLVRRSPPERNTHPVHADAMSIDTDIIGAGLNGLSKALHVREVGVDVAVIEAQEPGRGASGRNNGRVIPTLSPADPDAWERHCRETDKHFIRRDREWSKRAPPNGYRPGRSRARRDRHSVRPCGRRFRIGMANSIPPASMRAFARARVVETAVRSGRTVEARYRRSPAEGVPAHR
jgi:predicted NAD/FAD-dependent oxidoreductase